MEADRHSPPRGNSSRQAGSLPPSNDRATRCPARSCPASLLPARSVPKPARGRGRAARIPSRAAAACSQDRCCRPSKRHSTGIPTCDRRERRRRCSNLWRRKTLLRLRRGRKSAKTLSQVGFLGSARKRQRWRRRQWGQRQRQRQHPRQTSPPSVPQLQMRRVSQRVRPACGKGRRLMCARGCLLAHWQHFHRELPRQPGRWPAVGGVTPSQLP